MTEFAPQPFEGNAEGMLILSPEEASALQFALNSLKGQMVKRPEMSEPENEGLRTDRLEAIDKLSDNLTNVPGETAEVSLDFQARMATELALKSAVEKCDRSIAKADNEQDRQLFEQKKILLNGLLERLGAIES